MDTVYVVSTLSFSDELLDRLRAVSPRMVVMQQTASSADELPAGWWDRVEVLYTGSALPDPAHAPHLRWVQLHSAGVDHLQGTPLWRSDVAVTTSSGIHAPNIAEYVLAMMLAFARRLPRMLAYQARAEWPSQRWEKFAAPELRQATVGVIGYGSIGREIGRLAHAFGMRVLGLRRAKEAAGPPEYELPELVGRPGAEPDLLFTPDRLAEMLPVCDYVVLALPHTPATQHFINEATLRAMKPSALLVNIGRGALVDEAALVRALREGWIGGAALDVFEQEPLPADSPLWKMENVIISPHIAGFTPHYDERAAAVFAENLRRYLAGEPLLNRVERGRGY
jgi:phosphoglycerate dehydrogenase-like enzyme